MQIVPSFNKLLTNGHTKGTTLGDDPKVVPFLMYIYFCKSLGIGMRVATRAATMGSQTKSCITKGKP